MTPRPDERRATRSAFLRLILFLCVGAGLTVLSCAFILVLAVWHPMRWSSLPDDDGLIARRVGMAWILHAREEPAPHTASLVTLGWPLACLTRAAPCPHDAEIAGAVSIRPDCCDERLLLRDVGLYRVDLFGFLANTLLYAFGAWVLCSLAATWRRA